jgi:hypothetical protein
MPVPRNQVRFRQSEAARLLRAGKAPGVPVKLVVTRDGALTAVPLDTPAAPADSSWDELLDGNKPPLKIRTPIQGSPRKNAALLSAPKHGSKR